MNKILLFFFLGLSSTFWGQSAGFNNGFALVSVNGGANGYYCLQGTCGVNPNLHGYDFGQIALDTGSLVLNGVEINNWTCGGANISHVDMYYRVHPLGGPTGAFIYREIFFNYDYNNGCGGADKQFLKYADNNNLLDGITLPGTYEMELYVRQTTSSNGYQYMSNGGLNYKATFEVVCSLSPLNGTYYIPSVCFPTMASAVDYLNTYGISGSVTFNVAAGYTETAPSGGFRITGTGTAANPIVFQKYGTGANPTFTAGLQIAGRRNDAVFKIVGADYITLDGFTIRENSGNATLLPIGSNTMTEFGVALLYDTTTNGSQYITVQNCDIALNRDYRNSFGIYSNSTHADTNTLSGTTATSAAGSNMGLGLFGNTISNVNVGIVVIGPTLADLHQDGLIIGGTAAQGNTIINYGSGTHLTSFSNVSGLSNGINIKNVKNFTVSHNTISSTDGGIIAGQHRGIYVVSPNNTDPYSTTVNTISDNVFSIRMGVNAHLHGIVCETASVNNLSILNIENNTFTNFGHTVPTTSNINFIFNSTPALNVNINGNTIIDNTVNTTGTVTFFSNNVFKTDGSTHNFNNNTVENFSKTGAGSTVWGYRSGTASTGSAVTENMNGNRFENISVTGNAVLNGIHSTYGDSAVKTANNNVFSDITGDTGSVVLLNVSNSLTGGSIANNLIENISSQGEIQAINLPSGTQNVFKNIVHSVSTSGTVVSGIRIAGGSEWNIYQNKIYNLESTTSGTSSSVHGITATNGANMRIYNNVIGDLKAPAVSTADAIRGISITTPTFSYNYVSHNTIYLNASSSEANFGTSGIFLVGNANNLINNHTIRNNLVVNTSIASGTGRTVAFRRSSTTILNNYNTDSDHNAFYVGTPSESNVVFLNNSTAYQTLEAFQALVTPREQNSVYEEPVWVSVNGADADYLKLQDGSYTSRLESGGVLVTTPFTIDFDHVDEVRPGGVGIVNGGGQNVDIGAYEFDAIPYDRIPPVITFIPLIGNCGNPDIVLSGVRITDLHPAAVGVVTSGIFLPRVYYRQNSGAWSSVSGILTSGDAFDGLWTFHLTGLTSGNIEYYVIAQDSNGNLSANPDTGLIAVDVNTVTTHPVTPETLTFNAVVWNGSWIPASPTDQTPVIILSDYDTAVNGSFSACECHVEDTATVTIASGDYIELQGALYNEGVFTIQNNGSLVQILEAINAGEITYERIAQNVNKYDYVYWSSPVEGFSFSDIIGTSSRFRWAPVAPNANGGLGNWLNYYGEMFAGHGYIVRAPNTFPVIPNPGTTIQTNFYGVPNNGLIPVTIERGDMTTATVPSVYAHPALGIMDDNLNLVGNPYPSSLNAEAFLQHNAVTNPIIEGAIRLWTHGSTPASNMTVDNPFYGSFVYNYTPNDYIIYNMGGAVSGPATFDGFVASGQGFFVTMNEGNAATAQLEFTNAMRATSFNGQFYRTQTEATYEGEKHRIWLDLVQENGAVSRTLIGYMQGATMEKDVLYDAYIKPGTHLNLYSLLEDTTLAIHGRSLPFDIYDKVPLGVVIQQSGTYKLAIAYLDGLFEQGQAVYVEDKETGIIHLLTDEPYMFEALPGEYNQRFVLRYVNQTLNIPSFADADSSVMVAVHNKNVQIRSVEENIQSVGIFDLLGRRIFIQKNINHTVFSFDISYLASQTYLIKITLKNGITLTKKVILQ